jgi:predicted component of type VI protein secretion system
VILDTLAAAYAAAGDFERAATTAQDAASLAAAAGATALSGDIGGRLALYRQRKPYRETRAGTAVSR